MDNEDELLTYAPSEEDNEVGSRPNAANWRVMIVDDDEDVHFSTEYALRGLTFLDRSLEFIHAFSGAHAIELLGGTPDVAVILLDVVMETEDAGLRIVKTIRNELGLSDTRIILRTGQPGYAPEMEAIRLYEINDYKTKNELTRIKLYTTVTSAIRSYAQITRLNSNRKDLQCILNASNNFISALNISDFAAEVIRQIAEFMQTEPEGLVCARAITHHPFPVNHELIGAAGKYTSLMQLSLDGLTDVRIRNLIQTCLSERRTSFSPDGLVLFCPARSGSDFAVFVEAGNTTLQANRNLIDLFCNNIGLCGDNLLLINRLRDMATVDALVRLPNRLAFIEAIDAALKNNRHDGLIVMLLDIDRFAEVNNVLGSSYGDNLLMAIAERLHINLTDRTIIARVAGGGFGLLGPENLLSPKLIHALFQTPLEINGAEFLASFSMGVVRLADFNFSGAEVFHCASIARKRAKSSGQIAQTAYYTLEIQNEIRDSALLLNELRLALQNDTKQFHLVYQPQIELASGRVIGLEALARWKDSHGSVISPNRFIPIAEQSGLIVALGDWVLKTALFALKQLQGAGFTEINMAVNVSVAQFGHPDFIAGLDKNIRESGVITERLELEITESVGVIGSETIQNICRGLKNRRISIAIDDFGTGYSSLSYLDKFPADRLKIDRSFTNLIGKADHPGVRITEMVVPLGRQLGMKVIAEGVENAEQVKYLRRLGCDEIQGFHTGRPMEFTTLLEWLAANGGSVLLDT